MTEFDEFRRQRSRAPKAMHGQISADVVRKQVNHARFEWYENVLRDVEVRRRPSALSVAGHVMHRFHPGKGYAEFSAASAGRALNMRAETVKRARKYLLERGWLILIQPYRPSRQWSANRYSLGQGPEVLFDDDGVKEQ